MKKKVTKRVHTAAGQKGSGDYYGTGVKNPIGKMKSETVGMTPVSKRGLKKPPKSLA